MVVKTYSEGELSGHPDILSWWSQQTKQDESLLPMEVDDLVQAVFAVVLLGEEAPIAAAALVYAHTATGEHMVYGEKTLLELGSAFVEPPHRKQGHWGTLVKHRLTFLREHPEFMATCVTRKEVVSRGLIELGMVPLEVPELKAGLCCCPPGNREACAVCPHQEEVQTLWLPS